MIIPLNSETRLIEIVADRLAGKFIKPLFLFSKEKSYSAYIGGLAEILDWSMEFFDQYYDKVSTWENGKQGNNNYKAAMLDGLIVEFGHERIKKFYAQNTNHPSYFIEKYSALEL